MGCQCQTKQKLRVGHEDTTKTYKIDLEIKGQCHIGIMNVYAKLSLKDPVAPYVFILYAEKLALQMT